MSLSKKPGLSVAYVTTQTKLRHHVPVDAMRTSVRFIPDSEDVEIMAWVTRADMELHVRGAMEAGRSNEIITWMTYLERRGT